MPPPLKVLFVAHTATLGGANKSLRCLIEAFPPGTVVPHVACPEGPAVAQLQTVAAVHVIPGVSMVQNYTGGPLRGRRLATLLRSAWFLRHGSALGDLYDRLQPDVVHLNEAGMFQAAALAKRRGVPVVMHLRCPVDDGSPRLNRLLGRLMGRWVDRAVAIDGRVRHSWLAYAPHTPISVVYNPLSVGHWLRALRLRHDPSSNGNRATQGLPVRVSLVSVLLGYKGIWEWLHAAKRLRDRSDVIFCLVGGNAREREFYTSVVGRVARMLGLVEDLETRVREWIRMEDMEGRVEALGHLSDVGPILERTDVLVFPSHLDDVGRSVFEAGVYGVPSLVCLRSRSHDVVIDGVTGIVVPPRDVGALTAAIVKLADDPSLRQRMGRSARRRYLVQFSPRRSAKHVLRVYDSLVHGRRRQAASR